MHGHALPAALRAQILRQEQNVNRGFAPNKALKAQHSPAHSAGQVASRQSLLRPLRAHVSSVAACGHSGRLDPESAPFGQCSCLHAVPYATIAYAICCFHASQPLAPPCMQEAHPRYLICHAHVKSVQSVQSVGHYPEVRLASSCPLARHGGYHHDDQNLVR